METLDERLGAGRQKTANPRVPLPLPYSPLHPWTRVPSSSIHLQRCPGGVPLLLRIIPTTNHRLCDDGTPSFQSLPR